MVNKMARDLTPAEIEALASRKGVKRIAVENFLMSVTANNDMCAAWYNAQSDGRSYCWNGPTLKAIRDGINLAFGGR